MKPSHGSLEFPRGAPPPPPPPGGASTRSGTPWPLVGPPPPPTGTLCAPQPLYERPLSDDPGSGHAKASRPPPQPPVPKVPPPPAAAWPLSLHPFGGPLGSYPERGYEPGPPGEIPHPPSQLGGGLDGGPAVRNSNLKPLHWVTETRVVKGSLREEFQLDGERYNTFLNMHPPAPPPPPHPPSVYVEPAPPPPPMHEVPRPPPPPPSRCGGKPQPKDGAPPAPPPPPDAPKPSPPPGGTLRPPGPLPPSGVPGPPPSPGVPGPPNGSPPPPGRLGHGRTCGPAVKGSLWEEIQKIEGQSSPPEFEVSEIEAYFSNAPKKVVYKDAEKKKTISLKPEQVQLIDMRRANNTLIMLTKVKIPNPEIVDAILQLDGTLLDADRLENILKFCPTKEEMEQLKYYQGDKNMLGKCEKYFLELMRVPRMESKVNCFLFKIQFKTQLAEFKKSLNIVNAACDEVRKSDKLKGILKKILYLDNTLNQGTARGSAVGCRLDRLLKLTDTRSSISKITLMHYLCKFLSSKAPDLLDFHEDLVSLEAATKIQLKTLAEEMNSLAMGLKKVKLELDACRNDGEVSEGFHNALESFVGYAEAEVTSVTNFYSVVGRNADALALYFGEDPARCPFEQATQTLFNFVRLFRKSDEENQKFAEMERKKAEKDKENQKNAEIERKKAEQKGNE